MKNYYPQWQGVMMLPTALAKARGAQRSTSHTLHTHEAKRAVTRKYPGRPPGPSLHQAGVAVAAQNDLVIIILAGARGGGLCGGRSA